MKAVRFRGVGRRAEVVDVPRPAPGPGQVLLRIGGAGVCHSDLHLMDEDFGLGDDFTLGHENAGFVEEVGPGVTGVRPGTAVAVYGPWGCGLCHACQISEENYCELGGTVRELGGGLGFDGGMAEYMLVPSPRFLVPLGDLHPADAAPLTDAALTPYHAIRRERSRLHPGSVVVIIGIGGLGHMAVQIVKTLTGSRIVAVDVDPQKLELAKAMGADDVVRSDDVEQAAAAIRKITGPAGARLVVDCIGYQPTMDLGAKILGRNGAWAVVGLGGGKHELFFGSTPWGVRVSTPYWGTRSELMEVVALARAGRIRVETTKFPLDKAPEVYDRLREGRIHGRAVLVP